MGRGTRGRDLVKERFWRLAIGRQRVSGLSIAGFCRRERLSQAGFHSWRREIARRDAEALVAADADNVDRRRLASMSRAAASMTADGNVEGVVRRRHGRRGSDSTPCVSADAARGRRGSASMSTSTASSPSSTTAVAKRRSASAFVPVVVMGGADSAAVEIVLADCDLGGAGGSVTVRVPPGSDRETLALVLSALAERVQATSGGSVPARRAAGGPPC